VPGVEQRVSSKCPGPIPDAQEIEVKLRPE